MNDEMDAAETNPILPTSTESASPPERVPHDDRPVYHWLKRILACNPFYLLSAALLLFGLYRASVDPNFLPAEAAQLKFNFSSLQCYELLLVGTAVVLARRRIWYDSTLLVVLENLLVLVPFLLISQAALVEPTTGRLLCGAAALLVIGRSLVTRRWIAPFDYSPRLLAAGLGVLLVNSAWPVIYRFFQETKLGKKMTSGPAYEMNELSWFWLLPAVCTLALLLPRPGADEKSPGRRWWFPAGLFSLWLLGTGVPLYSLGYIYDFDQRIEQLAPALWVLAWVVSLRLADYVTNPAPAWRQAALALPLLVTFLAANATGSHVFRWLAACNLAAFAGTAWRQRGNHVAWHLMLLSLASFVAALPVELIPSWAGHFERAQVIGLAAVGYLIICTVLSRNPKLAIAGAIAAAWSVGLWRGEHSDTLHLAAQAGFVFFLLHSLRWQDYEHPGATLVRGLMATGWVIQSCFWVHDAAAFWHPLAMAGVILLVWWFRGVTFQRWTPVVVPGAAALVALCSPIHFALVKLQTTPVGVMAILGSFLLFAVGTALALTKHRWHKPEADMNP